MKNTITLPNDIWIYILSLLSDHNKLLLVKNIFKYYREQEILNMDNGFNECYKYHKDGNKTFLKMDWMNSLIFSIWMYKYH